MTALRFLLTLLLLSVALPAHAQCPQGVVYAAPANGQRVKVVALHPDDAYYATSSEVIGVVGRGTDLSVMDSCWIAGSFAGEDGQSYYFFKAAMYPLEGGPAEAMPGGSSCPSGAWSGDLAGGTRVRIAGLHPDDAFYSDRARMVGIEGRVDGEMHSNEGCWLGGSFTADNGDDYYFYKAAVVTLGAAPTPAPAPGKQYKGSVIRSGTTFIILDLHADDAYYPTRSGVIGKSCRASDEMQRQQAGWFSGPAVCEGEDYYFFKVGVAILQ